jgi:hypothetical protein
MLGRVRRGLLAAVAVKDSKEGEGERGYGGLREK